MSRGALFEGLSDSVAIDTLLQSGRGNPSTKPVLSTFYYFILRQDLSKVRPASAAQREKTNHEDQGLQQQTLDPVRMFWVWFPCTG